MKQTIGSESADKVGIIAPVQNRRARVANSFAIADIVTGAVLTVTSAIIWISVAASGGSR
ncbi:hypothetical protein BBK14_26550 [Parafrankia soli]|uniref:Uncharacterized protein n=1 Tax=Parafrankia soli TaxID=2599596 RepID=A0A1S1PLB6_9ACTN|nr:hypothetical protein [Parafrankia soli]OHV21472.1 hypothetical protein BBK14_26550 [Parafrankia soli]